MTMRVQWMTGWMVGVFGIGVAVAGDELGSSPSGEEQASSVVSSEVEPTSDGPIRYHLDPEESWLYVVVYGDKDRFSPVAAHDHGVRAMHFDGSVSWNPSDPSDCRVDISFPVSALTLDPPGMREREGLPLDGAISESNKETAEKNMRGKKNLLAEQYPEIRYAASSCVPDGDRVNVTGRLTIRGVGREITVPMTIDGSAERFRASGSFHIEHGDFGMVPFTYGPLTPKNLERLKVVVDVVGMPTDD